MLVTMSQKELNRIPVLQQVCDKLLTQIDDSHHDWFEGRASKCCLLIYIDDANRSADAPAVL